PQRRPQRIGHAEGAELHVAIAHAAFAPQVARVARQGDVFSQVGHCCLVVWSQSSPPLRAPRVRSRDGGGPSQFSNRCVVPSKNRFTVPVAPFLCFATRSSA